MVGILVFIVGLALVVQAFIGLSFFISSIWEREKRASILGGLQLVGMLAILILFLYLNSIQIFESGIGTGILVCMIIIGAITSLVLFRRIGSNPVALQGTKGLIVGEVKRFDGREIPPPGGEMPMDAPPGGAVPPPGDGNQAEKGMPQGSPPPMPAGPPPGMAPGPPGEAGAEGQDGPPGPNPLEFLFGGMGRMDRPHEGPNVAATIGSFVIPMYLGTPEKVKPRGFGKNISLSPEEATERIKGYTLHIGADMVGIAELNTLWNYSHHGMTSMNPVDFGKEINVDHKYAIVFADEMSLDLVGTAPHTPTSLETMAGYAKGAFISSQLAAFIANLGYSATANHLAHYESTMVPLAVDAGLGECSRMGYVITKEFGPRIRVSAVTTDIPLIPDKPVDIGVEDFCKICKKCVVNCPSNSIPHGDPVEVNGTLRWEHNGKTCAERWGNTGTDCGICMRVCPWSHARTFPHKLIVEGVSRNKLSRRIFSLMDDLFYGRKPEAKKGPRWARYQTD